MYQNIINSTKPILYETDYEEWPYAYAGSCYPARWKDKLYIISADHCYKNHGVKPEKTLYPIPDSEPRRFYGFNFKLTANTQYEKYKDQVILVVSNELHSQYEMKLTKAIDLSVSENLISLTDFKIKDVLLRGYLSENSLNEIDYENKKLKSQAYFTNGFISSRRSKFEFCHFLKVKTPFPNNLSPNGMSGSPVYAINNESKFGLAGTIIEFNSLTNEFLVIDSSVLRELLERENSPKT